MVSSARIDEMLRNLLLRGVIAQFVAFGLCEDAEECGIAFRYPMAEGKAANEDGDARKDGIEEVEGAHCADAYEVEQRPLAVAMVIRISSSHDCSACG